jgi:Flp pilus assembly protein TadD
MFSNTRSCVQRTFLLLVWLSLGAVVVSAAPAPEGAELEQALKRAENGELAAVEKTLLEYLKKDDAQAPRILEVLARGYLEGFRYKAAGSWVDRWLERQPDNTKALLLRAQLRQRTNNLDDAQKDYRRVLTLDAENDEACLLLAQGLLKAGQVQEALALFQQLQRRRPKDDEALLGLSHCYAALGRIAEAIALVDTVLQRQPKHVAALVARGRLALQVGQLAEAEQLLRSAFALQPSDYEACHGLVVCLMKAGKVEEAKQLVTKARQLEADNKRLAELPAKMDETPHDPALHCEIGVLLLRSGKEAQGVRWLRSAVLEDPQHRPAHRALAEYYERTGDKDQAARHRRLAEP